MTGANPRMITAAEIRAAMFGTPVSGIEVVRQAWRLTDDDSDEIALLRDGGSWWIARRTSDRLTVWACAGDLEADRDFDALLAADQHVRGPWHEATTRLAS